MRVLVTGSRGWVDRATILRQLKELGPGHTLVSGHARGADLIAETAAYFLRWEIETYPVTDADWKQYGKSAGHRRNATMVKTNPDICLAFILNDSPGATGCARVAEQHGILTRRFMAWT